MIVDSTTGKEKAFLLLLHDEHGNNPNALQKKNCKRCHYDVAEQSLIDYIKDHKGNEKFSGEDATGKARVFVFQNLKVVRGSLDDCIGWNTSWS